MNINKRKDKVKDQVILALFTAIVLLLAFTPIGLIDLPIIKATILHVPVIIGSVILGPKKGAFLGFVFGLTSIIKNTTAPSILSFAFSPFIPVLGLDKGSPWAVVICFIPRILVGVVPYFVVKGIEKFSKKENKGLRAVGTTVAAVVGAFTNTVLVMGMIYLVFKEPYAAANNIPVETVLTVILGVVGTNGVPEAIAAAVITTPVCFALDKALGKKKTAEVAAGEDIIV
ncbi:MAG: ECF transporter S component [Clostridia bacterium]|nr:ECF transporter S component [Clostridia bacterium]